MQSFNFYNIIILLVVFVCLGVFIFFRSVNSSISTTNVQTLTTSIVSTTKFVSVEKTYVSSSITATTTVTSAPVKDIRKEVDNKNSPKFVGPRGNAPTGTPTAYGFWSFAVLDGGKVSRSGQPLFSEFEWLSEKGWKGVVNLRYDGEYNEVSDDSEIPGFNELGFNYIRLPIRDGAAPTIEQANDFLKFVTDPKNQPVHVHCRGGFGRAGTLIALYRYEIDGWKMEDAIAESRLFRGGVDDTQKNWLLNWQKNNKK